MARQNIGIGAAPNDGTGDTLRVGGDKINDNFIECYNGLHWRGAWAGTTALPVDADNGGSDEDGDILAGNTFVFTNQVAFGGSVFPAKSVAIAIQNSPTTLAHWTILSPQS
jgi:hypothetical protein